MTDRRLLWVARTVFALATLFLVALCVTVALLIAQGALTAREGLPDAALALGTMTFAVVGFWITAHHPRNAVGWVLLGVGFVWLFGGVLDGYALWGFAHPDAAPAHRYAAALGQSLWVPGIAPLGTFVILLFPDGRLPTPKWRWWGRLCGLVVIGGWLGITFSPGPIEGAHPIQNPLGVDALAAVGPLIIAFILMIPICSIGCAVALVRRYRRAQGVQRMQLKWLAFAGAVTAIIYLAAMATSIPYDWSDGADVPLFVTIIQNVALAAFLLIPAAVGVAILRHRLYDIDRLINRALVYGGVSAFLIAVYVACVFGLGGAVRALTGQEQNNVAVAASTLAVAALFRPARASVQRFIDRRFYRRKYDAMRTVESFSARLRQETDLSALTLDLRAVVADTVQPTKVSLWIAGPAEGHLKQQQHQPQKPLVVVNS